VVVCRDVPAGVVPDALPYCSGMGNLIFAFILGETGGKGSDVMTNSLVNNVTNMTLVLGLPAVAWSLLNPG